jgi:hypothetical protein
MKALGCIEVGGQDDDQKKPDHSGKPELTQYHGPKYGCEVQIPEPEPVGIYGDDYPQQDQYQDSDYNR